HGLLSVLWHGPRAAHDVVVTCGGGMGGMLGPADGLYHALGCELADTHGIATMRVGYRKPNDLSRCVHDVAAAADLASRSGARGFVVIGHSFGGAVAIQAGIVLGAHCRGVVTLSTQSAGCEHASELGDTPLLLLHGTDDEILPPETSTVVQMLAGHGEVVLLSGAGHLLTEAATELRERLSVWIPERFAGAEG
ncbi:MAG: alpha/beta hydrolase, partial [Actinomycetota bacterium]|nr:alpha/beta hydrolase [Actinomycetota bacterium]